jgi:hypothetical protein
LREAVCPKGKRLHAKLKEQSGIFRAYPGIQLSRRRFLKIERKPAQAETANFFPLALASVLFIVGASGSLGFNDGQR